MIGCYCVNDYATQMSKLFFDPIGGWGFYPQPPKGDFILVSSRNHLFKAPSGNLGVVSKETVYSILGSSFSGF